MTTPLLPTIVRIVKQEGKATAYVVDAAEYRKYVLSSGIDIAIDEEDYLVQNPDVAKAIASGELPNGSYHFKFFGYFEGRQAKIVKVS